MAHIVTCMLNSDGEKGTYAAAKSNIEITVSPAASTDSLVSTSSSEERKPHVWRMAHPEPRKYQLFPKDRQPAAHSAIAVKQLDHEQPVSVAVGLTPERAEKPSIANDLRQRIKEHNLNRRRKISVPELGPMTTVQEVAMDSPTIPGRPALHERSISSPAQSGRHHHLATMMTTYQISDGDNAERIQAPRSAFRQERADQSLRQPLSPKDLAPLVIPKQPNSLPQLARKLSFSRLKSSTSSQDPNSLTIKAEDSPKTRTPFTPYTPLSTSGFTVTPRSATTALTASTIPTPVSAPVDQRISPHPWERSSSSTPDVPTAKPITESTSIAKGEAARPAQSPPASVHRRGQSDSGSIMERGRPRRRTDGTLVGGTHKRSASKRSTSAERRAFEVLPQGWSSNEAANHLEKEEMCYLRKQAVGQASKFEVLKKNDVETLSKELRYLDERTEYLRRTYTSLRAGRRNLHSRICQYLRSARVAKFSYESMLKQEEALAELDASIDDWVGKLEQAENRRTRVRQKLLEHVAAAATLPISSDIDVAAANESLQRAIGVQSASAASDLSTPPQSPTKSSAYEPSSSPSPQRVVARVPSMIPELPAEEEEGNPEVPARDPEEESMLKRMESIRIYADSDVYALLADVENEFTKLNGDGTTSPEPTAQPASDADRKELHRAQSRDILTGTPTPPPGSTPEPSPLVRNNTPTNGTGEILLTAAVFKPE